MLDYDKLKQQILKLAIRGIKAWNNYGPRIFLQKLLFKVQKRTIVVFKMLRIRERKSYSVKLIPTKPDVICFPVIDWNFRIQRPQHILQQFAQDGHVVYYINTNFRDDRQDQIQISTVEKNIKTVFLPGDPKIDIYRDIMNVKVFNGSLAALAEFVRSQEIGETICLVHHPFWTPLALALKERYGWKIVYDCMDLHGNFPNVSEQIPDLENDLVLKSDLVITTSRFLYNSVSPKNANCVLIPNAGDYAHFSHLTPHEKSRLTNILHPVIGFFGAIAEWIDIELLYQTAVSHPNWSFILIGEVTAGKQVRSIEKLLNVHFLGEKSYTELPNYLAAFDVCIIPFLRTLLTEAMNPVKIFEYLSAGKPIVARNLPELESLSNVVYLYDTHDEFNTLLTQAISEDSSVRKEKRQTVARQNTWEICYQSIKTAIETLYDKTSIIIVTWNNLKFTQICIQSILTDQTWPNYEIIVVDNASNDGTVEYLKSLSEHEKRIKVFYNKTNMGFASANNTGLQEVKDSEFVVLLNNDVIVPLGWLTRLLRYARQNEIGMVGPVTNFAGNEAKIDALYSDINTFASAIAKEKQQQSFDIPMLAMYCVVLRKEVFDLIGPLDERFGIGMFEDDDYSERVRQAGFRVVCAEDVFVHHYGRTSFNKLTEAEYTTLFERNKILFEKKWGKAWKPHQYRL